MTSHEAAPAVDAVTAFSALHEAATALAEAALPVARAIDAHDAVVAAYRGDDARALAIGQARSCVASCFEVVAYVLTIEHLLDERHVGAFAAQRPTTTSDSLTVVSPRDAWRRAVEALAYGSSYGGAALVALQDNSDPIAERLAPLVDAAEQVAAGLEVVEPFLVTGIEPAAVGARPPEPPARRGRPQPRWGPGA